MKKIYVLILIIAGYLVPYQSYSQYTKLLDFAGNSNGSYPYGDVISDGTFLYGMSSTGGANNLGVIFKIKPDGTGYSALLNFAGSSNGATPHGSLISDGTYMYGMTRTGGTQDYGTVFKIKTDGTGYAKLLDFTGNASLSKGKYPEGSLFSDGTYLYGMTSDGGLNNAGLLFKIKTDGTGYTKLLDFDGTNGLNPTGSLIYDGTFLYGMTYAGGSGGNGYGSIFKIKPDGTGYFELTDFTSNNGSAPYGTLILNGTFLYGITAYGGMGAGNIFKIKTDGTGYVSLYSFTQTTDGSSPMGSLCYDGTFFYGMTSFGSGGGNSGHIFKIKPDGTGYVNLFGFSGTSGGNPQGSVISDGTYLYGMTRDGGANSLGTIFKYRYAGCATMVGTTISPSSTVCAGTSVTLSGTGAVSYTWSGGVTNGTAFVPTSTATYTVTGTDATNCTSTATATITVNPLPTVSFSNLPAFINMNASAVTLTGNPSGGTFSGSGISGTSFNPSGTGLGTKQIHYSYTNSNSCTNIATLSTIVYDTSGTVCSVTDTLIINATLTGIAAPNNINILKIYPNPASDHITIDNGNYSSMNGYQIKIENALAQQVFISAINQQLFYIDLSTWTGNGIYFVRIIDGLGNTIVTKKIIIQ